MDIEMRVLIQRELGETAHVGIGRLAYSTEDR